MKTGDIEKQFGVSGTTIRRWVTEFKSFFSDSAVKKDSRNRSYTADDFVVLATIHSLSAQNFPYDAIREKLESGYRVEESVSQTVGYTDGRMVPAVAVEQIIDSTTVRVELEALKIDHARLMEELESERARVADRDQKIQVLQDRIADLQHKLGLAEGRLGEIDRQQNQKKGRWFGR